MKLEISKNIEALKEIAKNYESNKIAQVVYDKESDKYILRTRSKVWYSLIEGELNGEDFYVYYVVINDQGFLNIALNKGVLC